MTDSKQAPEIIAIPRWFKIAAILALVWNLLGVAAFIDHMMMTSEKIAQLPVAEQALYAAVPLWATFAFGVAVFTGVLGSVALLMKKIICYKLFVFSFIGVVVQMFHSFFISNSYEVYGPGGTIMPIMLIAITLLLVRFAAKGNSNNWFS